MKQPLLLIIVCQWRLQSAPLSSYKTAQMPALVSWGCCNKTLQGLKPRTWNSEFWRLGVKIKALTGLISSEPFSCIVVAFSLLIRLAVPLGRSPTVLTSVSLTHPLRCSPQTVTLWETRSLDFKGIGVLLRTELCPLPNQLTHPYLSSMRHMHVSVIYPPSVYLSVCQSVYLSIYLSDHSPIYHLSIDSTYSMYLATEILTDIFLL